MMRYGIFSDIHSNLEALEQVLEAYKNESIDKYLCVGDVVGYAANPKECVERVKSLCMITIAGNHDWASAGLFSVDYFNPDAKEAIFWTKRNLDDNSRYFLGSLKLIYKNEDLTLVHGTLNNPGDFDYMADGYSAWETFKLLEENICFVGHTHVAGFFIKGIDDSVYYRQDNYMDIEDAKKYIVNVGSVGQPRDGNPLGTYCIYDTEEKRVYIKRVNYDIQTTRNKIKEAGLPHFLADRLALGR